MSITLTKVLMRGQKGQIVIPELPMDQEVFFATLPPEIASEIGASCESLSARVQKEDGLSVEPKVFSLVVSGRGRKDQNSCYHVRESPDGTRFEISGGLGFRVDRESRMLELTRLPDFAYDHEP